VQQYGVVGQARTHVPVGGGEDAQVCAVRGAQRDLVATVFHGAEATDEDYQAVLNLVDHAVKRAWSAPRRDLLGLLPEAAQTPN
jgi:hypothetical protein